MFSCTNGISATDRHSYKNYFITVDSWSFANYLCLLVLLCLLCAAPAEVLLWVLFCKLMSSSQLLELHYVRWASFLPRLLYQLFITLLPLSFQRVHITVQGEDGKWKGLLVGDSIAWGGGFYLSQANVSSQLEVCSQMTMLRDWAILLIFQLPFHVDFWGFFSTVAKKMFKFSEDRSK